MAETTITIIIFQYVSLFTCNRLLRRVLSVPLILCATVYREIKIMEIKKKALTKVVRLTPARFDKIRKEAFKLRCPMIQVLDNAVDAYFEAKKSK